MGSAGPLRWRGGFVGIWRGRWPARGRSTDPHSDRGCPYCSHEYVDRLEQAGLPTSMTEEDHYAQNAMAERMTWDPPAGILSESRVQDGDADCIDPLIFALPSRQMGWPREGNPRGHRMGRARQIDGARSWIVVSEPAITRERQIADFEKFRPSSAGGAKGAEPLRASMQTKSNNQPKSDNSKSGLDPIPTRYSSPPLRCLKKPCTSALLSSSRTPSNQVTR